MQIWVIKSFLEANAILATLKLTLTLTIFTDDDDKSSSNQPHGPQVRQPAPLQIAVSEGSSLPDRGAPAAGAAAAARARRLHAQHRRRRGILPS